MAFKSAIPRRATILRESGRKTFNHSTGSKSQPCHARGRNGGKTTNHCARVSYGCKEGGDQTVKRTVEQNSGHNTSRLFRPNRPSNQERNPQEYIQDIRPFRSSFTRHLGWKDAVQRNIRRPSTLGPRSSQKAKENVGELGKNADWRSRSSKKPSRMPRRNLKYRFFLLSEMPVAKVIQQPCMQSHTSCQASPKVW